MPAKFNVTFDIVTPESAEDGDVEERGFIAENVPLREAIEHVLATRTSQCDGVECIEPSEMPGNGFRFVTVTNGAEFQTGAVESRSLHIPDHVTNASRARILRLIKQ